MFDARLRSGGAALPSKEVLSSGFQLIITQVPLMPSSEERATLALSSRAVMNADRAEWVETCGV